MAMTAGGPRGGLNATINVTPLVDVMLVLLIIMMLVAPLLQKGVNVKLPEAGNTVDKPEVQGQTVVAITRDRKVYVNSVEIREEDLQGRVQDALEGSTERIVLIKADEEAPYGAIMSAMDELRKAGIEDIGLITERKLHAGQTGGK
jgi:biopolymer transport protein TolR